MWKFHCERDAVLAALVKTDLTLASHFQKFPGTNLLWSFTLQTSGRFLDNVMVDGTIDETTK